jgi:hypothetical protein
MVIPGLTSRRITTVVGAAALLAGMALVALPAQASTLRPATALTVSLSCFPDGNFTFDCTATPSGGVAPYTARWSDGLTGLSISGHCGTTPPNNSVTVTVTDAVGSTASATKGFGCFGGDR